MGSEGDFVVRGGYTRAFSRTGMNDFTGVFNANPGITITANREEGQREPRRGCRCCSATPSRLGPPAFPQTPSYPMTDVVTEDIRIFDPNIQVPYADSWTVGVQRGIGTRHGGRGALRRHARQIVAHAGQRQLGRSIASTTTRSNIFENGFLNEFTLAQANLQANIAAGRGATFAYTGAAGHGAAADLPRVLQRRSRRQRPATRALYTGTNWTNQTFLNSLAVRNPNPFGFASTLSRPTATRSEQRQRADEQRRLRTRGPDPGELLRRQPGPARRRDRDEHRRDRATTRCSSNCAAATRRGCSSRRATSSATPTSATSDRSAAICSGGATPARQATSRTSSRRTSSTTCRSARAALRQRTPTASSIASSAAGRSGCQRRLQSGRLVDLGNVRLVGMTRDDVRRACSSCASTTRAASVYMLPQDVIDNTIHAFSVSATSATGYSGAAPDRPLLRAGERTGLHRGRQRGTSTAACAARSLVVTGPDVPAARPAHLEADADRRRGDFEFARRGAERVQPRQLRAGGRDRQHAGELRGDGLTGTNTARVIQLVTRINW